MLFGVKNLNKLRARRWSLKCWCGTGEDVAIGVGQEIVVERENVEDVGGDGHAVFLESGVESGDHKSRDRVEFNLQLGGRNLTDCAHRDENLVNKEGGNVCRCKETIDSNTSSELDIFDIKLDGKLGSTIESRPELNVD